MSQPRRASSNTPRTQTPPTMQLHRSAAALTRRSSVWPPTTRSTTARRTRVLQPCRAQRSASAPSTQQLTWQHQTHVPSLSSQEVEALLPQPDSEQLRDWAAQAAAYAAPDEMSLWDEDGRHFSSARTLKHAYQPPTSDLPGLAVAGSLLLCWAAMFQHAIWGFDLTGPATLPHLLDGLFSFAALEFLSTGLFITTHDSMHGAVTPNNRFLNDLIGGLCVTLYAWFDYKLMWRKHWAHHNECGTPHEDPDFHRGDPAFLPWFTSFVKGYVSPLQVGKLVVVTTALAVFGGAPLANQGVFWAGTGLVSATRLFYFGTYLPHKPRNGAGEVMAWAKARSDKQHAWLSFLQCFCFGMHWEHHRWPAAPWWELHRARAVRYNAIGSLDN